MHPAGLPRHRRWIASAQTLDGGADDIFVYQADGHLADPLNHMTLVWGNGYAMTSSGMETEHDCIFGFFGHGCDPKPQRMLRLGLRLAPGKENRICERNGEP